MRLGKAVLALGGFGNHEAVSALIEVLSDTSLDENHSYCMPSERGFAASSLGKIGARKATGILIDALKECRADVRFRATKALGDVGDETAIEPLLSVIQDENYVVRWCAAESLGKIGNSAILENLLKTSEDKNRIVSGKAEGAIEAIKERLRQ